MYDSAFQASITALKYIDHNVRCKAAQALGKAKDKRAVEPLISSMMDSNEFVRMDVAWALGQIGDTRAVESLIHALQDIHGYVRREAAIALGEIGDNRAIEPLINNVRTDDKSAAAAAKALSKITGETVQAILLKWA